MKKNFGRNHRLRFVFRICKDLGIDDPVAWMNAVDPRLVDQWIAFYCAEDDGEVEGPQSPEQALKQLQDMTNG